MAALVVLHGAVTLQGGETASAGELALFALAGEEIALEATQDATILVLSGEPIQESVVAYGPFVMNTQQEISQAIQDYQSGKMGTLP